MASKPPPSAKQVNVTASPPDISILGDSVTLYPSGYTEAADGTNATRTSGEEEALIDTMARFRSSPFDFFREVSLYVNGEGWRGYDRIVGAPVYYPGFTETMKGKVMQNTQLKDKIAELARKRVEVEKKEGLLSVRGNGEAEARRRRDLEASLREVVDEMLDNMVPQLESKRFIRSAYYLVTQLLTRMYHQGVHVSSEEILRLRAVAELAAKNKQSIIFLPSHRSHVDYVSNQIICYRLGLTLPAVVAGDNLNFPLVGPFLQKAGALWIRRSFGNDQLYSTTVQAFIDTILQNGYNFECFIEGGRSRTGKLLGPKFGILRFLLEPVLAGRVKDAIVCPVSCQYDKVIEVDSYITELLGQPKQKENLTDFLSASSLLNLKLGRVDVRFHEPWSLRSYIDAQAVKFSRLGKQIDTKPEWTPERRTMLLRSLGYRVLSDINDVSVVMPTALIGTVILTLRGRGVGKSELVRRVDWLCERVKQKGGRVAHFGNLPTETVVERGLEVLGPALVGRVPNLPEDTYYAVDRFQLSFYRNMTIHLFILEALLCAGLYTRVKLGGGPANQRMTYAQLKAEVTFLSQLFRGEFIFPPEGLEANFHKAVTGLEADGVLQVNRTDAASARPEDVTDIELSAAERERGRENFDFYCFLIWPFIEASWLGAVSLLMLTPPLDVRAATTAGSAAAAAAAADRDRWVDAKASQDRAQLLGKTLYHQGDLSYFEAVNKETLKNAYARFAEEGMIEVRGSSPNGVGGPALRLATGWLPARDTDTGLVTADGKLWQFAEAVSQSRREGKNRRDGNTVAGRVLGLVDVVGKALWEEPAPTKKQQKTQKQSGKKEGATGVLKKNGGAAAVALDQDEKTRQRRRTTIQPASRL